MEAEPNLCKFGEQEERRVFKAADILSALGNCVSGHY